MTSSLVGGFHLRSGDVEDLAVCNETKGIWEENSEEKYMYGACIRVRKAFRKTNTAIASGDTVMCEHSDVLLLLFEKERLSTEIHWDEKSRSKQNFQRKTISRLRCMKGFLALKQERKGHADCMTVAAGQNDARWFKWPAWRCHISRTTRLETNLWIEMGEWRDEGRPTIVLRNEFEAVKRKLNILIRFY